MQPVNKNGKRRNKSVSKPAPQGRQLWKTPEKSTDYYDTKPKEIQEKGEYTGVREFRKHIAYYTKGMPKSSEFRCKINTIETKEEVLDLINKYLIYMGEENV